MNTSALAAARFAGIEPDILRSTGCSSASAGLQTPLLSTVEIDEPADDLHVRRAKAARIFSCQTSHGESLSWLWSQRSNREHKVYDWTSVWGSQESHGKAPLHAVGGAGACLDLRFRRRLWQLLAGSLPRWWTLLLVGLSLSESVVVSKCAARSHRLS